MKILVIRHRFIGDTILTIPFLRNLRNAYPNAQIDMLIGSDSFDILNECPYINNLTVFDTKKTGKSFWQYAKEIKNNNYDKAYILKRSFSTAFLAFWAGIKERIGFDTEHRGFLLTKRVKYSKTKHEIECFLDILRADNISVNDNYLENWISTEQKENINKLLGSFSIDNKRKVIIHAAGSNANKRWPAKNFANTIEYLLNEASAQVFFVGTEKDLTIYKEISGLLKNKLLEKPINLCGKLSLKELTAFIEASNLVIGVDSGILHIAASVNTPVIGLYGLMNPEKWKAWGDIHTILYSKRSCVPCELKKECPKNLACMEDITSMQVIDSINKIFQTKV